MSTGRQDPLAPFNGHGSIYIDSLWAWPNDEPAIDFTSMGMLAFALTAN